MNQPYLDLYKKIAAEYGLDWRLLLEQGWRESRWDREAVGGAGEYGLMQIHPPTWNQWAAKVGVSDPFDPDSNIRVAAAYWVWIKEQLVARDLHETYWVLVAYNWGINNLLRLLEKGGGWDDLSPQVRDYVCDIILSAQMLAVRETFDPPYEDERASREDTLAALPPAMG